jgi:hypothetical protein
MISLNRLLGISVRPSVSSRPPSPGLSCTIIYNYFNRSVVSIDSEVTGTTINDGLMKVRHVQCSDQRADFKTDDRHRNPLDSS